MPTQLVIKMGCSGGVAAAPVTQYKDTGGRSGKAAAHAPAAQAGWRLEEWLKVELLMDCWTCSTP